MFWLLLLWFCFLYVFHADFFVKLSLHFLIRNKQLNRQSIWKTAGYWNFPLSSLCLFACASWVSSSLFISGDVTLWRVFCMSKQVYYADCLFQLWCHFALAWKRSRRRFYWLCKSPLCWGISIRVYQQVVWAHIHRRLIRCSYVNSSRLTAKRQQ